jgi:hypothetical protein
MTKADLKNGMFGVVDSNGFEQRFVIVDGLMVYQTGGWDIVDTLSDDLVFPMTNRKIVKLFEVNCFDAAEDSFGMIWERDSEPKEDGWLTPELKKEFDNIAKAKRTVYQSYVDAGFTD